MKKGLRKDLCGILQFFWQFDVTVFTWTQKFQSVKWFSIPARDFLLISCHSELCKSVRKTKMNTNEYKKWFFVLGVVFRPWKQLVTLLIVQLLRVYRTCLATATIVLCFLRNGTDEQEIKKRTRDLITKLIIMKKKTRITEKRSWNNIRL